jgi:hypothetical protein
MDKQKRFIQIAILLASLLYLFCPQLTAADPTASSSTSYSVQDTSFGTGSQNTNLISGCSTNYCANSSVGSLAVGNPASISYQLHAGYETTNQPYLYFMVTNSTTNLGLLSALTTATATGQFTVRTYQAGGYQVQSVSQPPTNGEGYFLHTTGAGACVLNPAAGTEFFGINVVADTIPASFTTDSPPSANPVINPVSGPAAGAAGTGYGTQNCFKYNVNDSIANSTSPGNTTGEADYTISFIFNISSSATKAGYYNFNDILVATATY